MDWSLLSPFDLSQFFWLVVACYFHVPYQNRLVKNDSCRWLLGWAVSVSVSLTDSESALWAEISQNPVLACYLGVAGDCDFNTCPGGVHFDPLVEVLSISLHCSYSFSFCN